MNTQSADTPPATSFLDLYKQSLVRKKELTENLNHTEQWLADHPSQSLIEMQKQLKEQREKLRDARIDVESTAKPTQKQRELLNDLSRQVTILESDYKLVEQKRKDMTHAMGELTKQRARASSSSDMLLHSARRARASTINQVEIDQFLHMLARFTITYCDARGGNYQHPVGKILNWAISGNGNALCSVQDYTTIREKMRKELDAELLKD